MTGVEIDARGMRCPWPALRFARAMREAVVGQAVMIVADDPKAENEIRQLAEANGWPLIVQEKDDEQKFIVTR